MIRPKHTFESVTTELADGLEAGTIKLRLASEDEDGSIAEFKELLRIQDHLARGQEELREALARIHQDLVQLLTRSAQERVVQLHQELAVQLARLQQDLTELRSEVRGLTNTPVPAEHTEPVLAIRVDEGLEGRLNMSLAELDLSIRATNCLEAEGITTVRDLVVRSAEELLQIRNFGETTLREVNSKLAEHGLSLGMRLPSSLPG